MNIEDTLAPTSDQLDAIELVAGPRTFVIESVIAGSVEQPVQVKLVGFPRVWRPSKGMRRVLAAGWGVNASAWAGRSVTLYFDPDVSFGKDRTGGTRISHMSHLSKRLSVPLLISRGKSAMFTVEPLPDAPDPITETQMTELVAAFQKAKITEGVDKLAFAVEVIGRSIAGPKDLRRVEASRVLDQLRAVTAAAPTDEPEPFGGEQA